MGGNLLYIGQFQYLPGLSSSRGAVRFSGSSRVLPTGNADPRTFCWKPPEMALGNGRGAHENLCCHV